jgi:hypothetical protein
MNARRWLGLATLLGGLGCMATFLLPPRWGPPGTAAYVVYQNWNRLTGLALLVMGLGGLGLFLNLRPRLGRLARAGALTLLAGAGLTLLGSVAEFWVFKDVPYAGSGGGVNARGLAWMTFLVGGLVLLLGGAVTGLAALRHIARPT